MLFTVVSGLLIFLSYKRKNGVKYMYSSMVLAVFRNSIRMLDLENTRNKQSELQWILLFTNQLLGVVIYLMIMIFMFGNVKYNNIVLVINIIIVYVFAYYSWSIRKDFVLNQALMHLPLQVFVVAFPLLFGHHLPKLIKEIFKKGKLNNKFK